MEKGDEGHYFASAPRKSGHPAGRDRRDHENGRKNSQVATTVESKTIDRSSTMMDQSRENSLLSPLSLLFSPLSSFLFDSNSSIYSKDDDDILYYFHFLSYFFRWSFSSEICFYFFPLSGHRVVF